MFKGITDFFVVLGQLLPPWALALLGGVLLIAVLPGWLHSMRVKQIKGAVRKMVRAEPEAKAQLVDRVFGIAAQSVGRLEAVAHEAHKMGQQRVRDRALAELESLGRPDLAERIRNKDSKPPPRVIGHPLEAVVPIRNLLEQEMYGTAEARLREAFERFPGDPDLMALQRELEAARAGTEA